MLIVDWDGTATTEDTLIKAMEVYGDWDLYLEASAALKRGEITLHEEIRRDATGIKAPLEDVQRWVVDNIDLRPGFGEFARKHAPVIISSNFRQLIEPILAREGLELEVRANEVEWHPDGWRASFRNNDDCDTCGEPCKRPDVAGDGDVIYVGDGYSDRCAAQAADRVFARRALARYLDEHGVAYEPFEDFYDIDRAL